MDVKIFDELKDEPNVEVYIGDTISLIIITGGIIEDNIPVFKWMQENFDFKNSLLIGHFSRYSLDLDIKILFFN